MMMHLRLISGLFLLISSQLFAQEERLIPVNEKTGLAEYTEVVDVAGVSAGDLYARAELWANEFFPNPAGTIEKKDSAVQLSGQTQFRLTLTDKKGNQTPSGYVVYDFSIEFKDGKYRYVIDKIRMKASSYFDVSKWEDKDDPEYQEERYTQYVQQTVDYFNSMIDGMVEAMNTPIEEESSDW